MNLDIHLLIAPVFSFIKEELNTIGIVMLVKIDSLISKKKIEVEAEENIQVKNVVNIDLIDTKDEAFLIRKNRMMKVDMLKILDMEKN